MATKTYTGNSNGFKLEETDVVGGKVIIITFDSLPDDIITSTLTYLVSGTPTTKNLGLSNPMTALVDSLSVSYNVVLTPSVGSDTTITFLLDPDINTQDLLHISFLNVVKFFRVNRFQLQQAKYFTKHFDDFMFSERLYDWEDELHFCQIWQTTDIVRIQLESVSGPIIVSLLDEFGDPVPGKVLPALIGLPHKYLLDTFVYEVELALAGLQSGCYYIQIEVGSGGDLQTFISGCQSISSTQIENSVLIEYRNNESKDDVLFETGIDFMWRVFGHFGFLDPGRKDETSRDQRWNPTTQSSIAYRSWPFYMGDSYGTIDDDIDRLNRVLGCDDIRIDRKPYGLSDNSKFEFIDSDSAYKKRGVKVLLDEGINRNSKIFSLSNINTDKKLFWSLAVDPGLYGALGTDESSNAIQIIKKF